MIQCRVANLSVPFEVHPETWGEHKAPYLRSAPGAVPPCCSCWWLSQGVVPLGCGLGVQPAAGPCQRCDLGSRCWDTFPLTDRCSSHLPDLSPARPFCLSWAGDLQRPSPELPVSRLRLRDSRWVTSAVRGSVCAGDTKGSKLWAF